MLKAIRNKLRPYIIKTRLWYLKIIRINSVQPVSKFFGVDRGTPIDRYYIENFLNMNKQYIRGSVLEVADNTYTIRFGRGVTKSTTLHLTDKVNENDIVGNLATGENIPENEFDCFILTQTLLVIFEVKEAAKNAIKLLKRNGVLLVTVPGITPISRYDMENWGQYWSFTHLSIRKIFEEIVPAQNIKIEVFGNCKAAKLFLSGLATFEVNKKVLDYYDQDFPVIIAAQITKP